MLLYFIFALQEHRKMKKLLFFILLFIIACCVVVFLFQPDQREPQERFREGMNFEQFSVYTDSIFDYQFEYPSFLRREHVEGYGCGHVQFGFHNGVNIVMECKVVPESVYAYRRGNFMQRGRLADMPDHAYTSHYIRRHRRWYVLTLYYPVSYQKAVGRILYKVETWQAAGADYSLLKRRFRSKCKSKGTSSHRE